jgi:uncharacterized membrane protein YdbT with pleckstrin-like domain
VDPEPGEQVFFHGHPSWRSILDFYLKGVLAAVIAGAIVGVITRVASHKVSVVLVIVAALVVYLVVLAVGFVRRLRTTYTISSRRLTIERGLVSRDMQEMRLERVQNVNYTQSMLERILRIGTVDFDTAGSADFDFRFLGVAEPHAIVRTVDQAQQQLSPSGPSGPSGTRSDL